MPEIPNAGQFGAGAFLPTDPGPVDPPILTGNYPYDFGNTYPSGGDLRTHMDPGMGYLEPSLTIYPGNPADAYPEPGTGAPPAPPASRPNLLGRVVNNIPAVRMARFLAGLMQGRGETWRQNAASNVPVQPALPTNATVFGYNPNSGGGGGTSRYNYGTQSYSPTPSTNPLYSTGGNAFAPVSGAGTDIRWAPNSGTGNFQASQTTKAFEAGGGYPGTPNRTTVTDRGVDRFRVLLGPGGVTTTHRADPEGAGFTSADTTITPESIARQAAGRALYAQAMRAVPVDPRYGWTVEHTKAINDWLMAHGTTANMPLPLGAIAQQPILPGT